MIPKIIHYCWFGKGEKSNLIKQCIKSWKEYCPDYQIIEWNEGNFDVSIHDYIKVAYENKYWAFVSDYARLKIIYENGGIYLDTDVELIKSLDCLLEDKFFCGFELPNRLNTGIGFGAEKNSFLTRKMLEEYDNVNFINFDGSLNKVPCTFYNSNALVKQGALLNNTLQKTSTFTIYPTDFFSPKSYETGFVDMTKNTVSIHHFESSWEDIKSLSKKRKQHQICNFFGVYIGTKIIYIIDLFGVVRKKGIFGIIKGSYRRLGRAFNLIVNKK